MEQMTNKIRSIFHDRFETNPEIICSPGRVNLIGEHTDYNKGFVLPAAIDKYILLAMARNEQQKIRLYSVDMDSGYFETEVAREYKKAEINWSNYIIGVVDELEKAGHVIGGFDCVFGGNIPIGAGLSSSAALESGVVFGLNRLYDLGLTRLEMITIAMQAENRFVGVQCGIMDQFACINGKKNSVIKLDCSSLEFQRYPFDRKDIRIMLCDTKVRRELATSEYNIRREQCEEGVDTLRKYYPSINYLRDVSMPQLEKHEKDFDPVVYRRCCYVLLENSRVLKSCEDLMNQDFSSVGRRMYQSHYGLRDDYEVSCPELDILVKASESMEGVLGARMMGGGFGGCTINLVLHDKIDHIASNIEQYYHRQMGIMPDIHVVAIGEGTHLISGNS